MPKINKTIAWLTLIVAVLVAFTVSVQSILLPFVLGFVLAYFLQPAVDGLQCKHISRGLATSLVVVLFCWVVLMLFLIFVPLLQAQIMTLMVKIPAVAQMIWNHIREIIIYAQENIAQERLEQLSGAVSQTVVNVFNSLGTGLLKMLSGGAVVFNVISLLLITPVVLFYVLRDWKGVETKMTELIPDKQKERVLSVMEEINRTLSGFIRGQATVCLVLGVFYALGLSLAGLDFGLLVGFLSGILSFIPYFGFLTGVILSILLGLVQQGGWSLWIGLLVVFSLGQVLESYVLTPKLVGDKVGLHPVWVIFALLAGGVLLGFLGVLIAVPVAAVIGVFVRHILVWYKNTSVYKGTK